MRAFTLIELIVVLSIIIFMTALGVPAFQGFGAQQQLDQEAERAASLVRETQAMALAPLGGDVSYSVYFTPPASLEMKARTGTASRVLKAIVLSRNISFSENNEWVFNIADQGRLAADRTVTLIHNSLGATRAKRVIGTSASGLIQVQ